MDFLSDTTRKERRNLLAAGFAGIIVAQLKIYPTAMDVVGLKFQSTELPLIAIGGLCAAVIYFLIKFWSSYLYEQSSATTEDLAAQIQQGKTAMDIAREEQALNDLLRQIIQQRKTLQEQENNEQGRIENLRKDIEKAEVAHELSIKAHDKKLKDLNLAVITIDEEIVRRYMNLPSQLITDAIIKKEIQKTEDARASLQATRQSDREKQVRNLENEKIRRIELYESQVRKFDIDEEDANNKRESITKWKQAHAKVGMVSPIHRFLELYFPLIIGAVAIAGLISLMLHFPPPPKPVPLPPL